MRDLTQGLLLGGLMTKLLSLTSFNGFQQIINEPTHIQRQSSSCIDLIFTDQPNLSVNSAILFHIKL